MATLQDLVEAVDLLQDSVSDLTVQVNVRKANLDDAITEAEASATVATEAAQSMPLQITPITLAVAGWALVGDLYEYDYANVAIKSISVVDIVPSNSTIEIVKSASILPETISSTGSVKIYAENLPTADIVVTLNIFK